ncbi:MAG: ergothioneine biosynthesis protein EgtB, partial [Planctomycetota bacterium]
MSTIEGRPPANAPGTTSETPSDPGALADRYAATRGLSLDLTAPLTDEDCCVQSQPCCSPTKWHLGHTTWFFERFILLDALGQRPHDERYEFLFNSYYNALGERQPRACRGLLTRPSRSEVVEFRESVDERLTAALRRGDVPESAMPALELGLNHEQQHQELLLMDIKHLLSCSPLDLAYCRDEPEARPATRLGWVGFEGGLRSIGTTFGHDPTIYDNECPVHRVYLEPFEIADRLITNGDYADFIADGGYERPEFWLDMGWTHVQQHGWTKPAYWCEADGRWHEFSLRGRHPLCDTEPVCHVSYFEADAYARWAGARLPTEFELEAAQLEHPQTRGTMLEDRRFHPGHVGEPDEHSGRPRQLVGDCWEWTSSSYGPYPGFACPKGAVGEYNGKFMCNQYVLRGG